MHEALAEGEGILPRPPRERERKLLRGVREIGDLMRILFRDCPIGA